MRWRIWELSDLCHLHRYLQIAQTKLARLRCRRDTVVCQPQLQPEDSRIRTWITSTFPPRPGKFQSMSQRILGRPPHMLGSATATSRPLNRIRPSHLMLSVRRIFLQVLSMAMLLEGVTFLQVAQHLLLRTCLMKIEELRQGLVQLLSPCGRIIERPRLEDIHLCLSHSLKAVPRRKGRSRPLHMDRIHSGLPHVQRCIQGVVTQE